MSRPICEGCGRPMPLTDDERMELQRRELKEFEDVLDRTPRRRSKTPTSTNPRGSTNG